VRASADYSRSRSFVIAHPTRVPDWSLPWIAMVNAVYFGVTIAALALQQNCPAAGRRWLRAMNYALLAAFPFGTAVAAYWFRKVDRPSVA
jgi:hypothetical protein